MPFLKPFCQSENKTTISVFSLLKRYSNKVPNNFLKYKYKIKYEIKVKSHILRTYKHILL